MRIKIYRFESSGFEPVEVLNYCCDKMAEAVSNGMIELEFEFDDLDRKMRTGCFIRGPDYEGHSHAFIRYCPFCGERIEIEKAGEENKS